MGFEKGDPRINRNGRPVGSKSLSTSLKEALLEFERNTGKSFKELLIAQLLKNAIEKGEIRAIREIFDRVEGKPAQAINFNNITPTPEEIIFRVEYGNQYATPDPEEEDDNAGDEGIRGESDEQGEDNG